MQSYPHIFLFTYELDSAVRLLVTQHMQRLPPELLRAVAYSLAFGDDVRGSSKDLASFSRVNRLFASVWQDLMILLPSHERYVHLTKIKFTKLDDVRRLSTNLDLLDTARFSHPVTSIVMGRKRVLPPDIRTALARLPNLHEVVLMQAAASSSYPEYRGTPSVAITLHFKQDQRPHVAKLHSSLAFMERRWARRFRVHRHMVKDRCPGRASEPHDRRMLAQDAHLERLLERLAPRTQSLDIKSADDAGELEGYIAGLSSTFMSITELALDLTGGTFVAKGLRSSISRSSLNKTLFQAHFPRLRVLKLYCHDIAPQDWFAFSRFLRDHRELRTLHLRTCFVSNPLTGFWIVMNEIRDRGLQAASVTIRPPEHLRSVGRWKHEETVDQLIGHSEEFRGLLDISALQSIRQHF